MVPGTSFGSPFTYFHSHLGEGGRCCFPKLELDWVPVPDRSPSFFFLETQREGYCICRGEGTLEFAFPEQKLKGCPVPESLWPICLVPKWTKGGGAQECRRDSVQSRAVGGPIFLQRAAAFPFTQFQYI